MEYKYSHELILQYFFHNLINNYFIRNYSGYFPYYLHTYTNVIVLEKFIINLILNLILDFFIHLYVHINVHSNKQYIYCNYMIFYHI